jgi:hypothetical protein
VQGYFKKALIQHQLHFCIGPRTVGVSVGLWFGVRKIPYMKGQGFQDSEWLV